MAGVGSAASPSFGQELRETGSTASSCSRDLPDAAGKVGALKYVLVPSALLISPNEIEICAWVLVVQYGDQSGMEVSPSGFFYK